MARPARRSGNLPAEAASFIGRRRELAEVGDPALVSRAVMTALADKQIGARLFISERTVDSHVRSILNKPGFSSRARIAAWMAGPDV